MFDRDGGDGEVVFLKDDAFLDRVEVDVEIFEVSGYDVDIIKEAFDAFEGKFTRVDIDAVDGFPTGEGGEDASETKDVI